MPLKSLQMSFRLNSLKGDYIEDYIREYYRAYLGDTMSLDYSSDAASRAKLFNLRNSGLGGF